MGRKVGFIIILSLVAVAAFAVVDDRLTRSKASNIDFVNPPTVYATSTANPPPR